jgi:hypothetical protein
VTLQNKLYKGTEKITIAIIVKRIEDINRIVLDLEVKITLQKY